ncbi:MAG: hypothetical protein WCO93_07305 [bacterium]
MANDMRNLSDEILSSYKMRAAEFQQRLRDNSKLVKDVQHTLDGFRKDHMEMAAAIRASADKMRSGLAKGEKDRLKSFHQMMNGINGTISQIQGEVQNLKVTTTDMLKDFSVSHAEMAFKLDKDLEKDKTGRMKWNSGRMKEFDGMMKNINSEIGKIQQEVGDVFGYTSKLLKKFSKDHKVMSSTQRAELKANLTERVEYTQSLLRQFDKKLAEMGKENQKMAKALRSELLKSREELSQSESERMKDFNITFSGIQGKVKEIRSYVDTYLDDFTKDRKQAAATWEKLAQAIAKLGKSEPAPVVNKPAVVPAPAVKKPAAIKVDEVKREIPVEKKVEVAAPKARIIPKKVIQVKKEKEILVPQKEMTLEEKVLSYINAHKKGVRVADMEKPFGETRMRIGFITKKLLDEGKVQRIDNIYYPLVKK